MRLLTGVARYDEMTYVFDLLHQNHRFEILLRKKADADRRQSGGLKAALLDYLKRCLPADSEKHNMVALCFSMRREIGENHEMAARTQLKMIESQAWGEPPPPQRHHHRRPSFSNSAFAPDSRHAGTEELAGEGVGSAEGRRRELLQGTSASPDAWSPELV